MASTLPARNRPTVVLPPTLPHPPLCFYICGPLSFFHRSLAAPPDVTHPPQLQQDGQAHKHLSSQVRTACIYACACMFLYAGQTAIHMHAHCMVLVLVLLPVYVWFATVVFLARPGKTAGP